MWHQRGVQGSGGAVAVHGRVVGGRRVFGIEAAAALVAEEGIEADFREEALKFVRWTRSTWVDLQDGQFIMVPTTSHKNGRPVGEEFGRAK